MEISKFLEHIPCTFPDCSSSDGMALYESSRTHALTGYCFVCKRYDPNPLKQKETYEETNVTYFDSIGELPSKGDPTRALEEWSMHYFGVKTALSTADGSTVTDHFYPYTRDGQVVAYKHRHLPKDFDCVGDYKNLDLFGQAQAKASGSKKLWITEGELDAVTLYQVLRQNASGTKWATLIPAVVSICNGSNAAVKDISRNLSFVNSFDEVILVFDQDTAGKQATEDVLKLIPNALVATFEHKDPNEMLLQGKAERLARACLFNAQKHKPSNFVTVSDILDRVLERPQMGLSWPWPSLDKVTYGIHRKTIYGLGAGVGLGKTEWAKEVQSKLLYEHKVPVAAFMLEEDAARTVKALAGKRAGKMFTRPDLDYNDEELRKYAEELSGRLFLYDHMGVKDWDDIKATIRYAVVSEGVKDIFIDPLSALVAHLSSSEANDMLNAVMSDLSGMVHELDFTAYYLAHLNLPNAGPAHEQGGEPLESQMTGSRAMQKWSHYIFMLKGNKSPELTEEERNTRELIVRKDRYFGNVAKVPLSYNPHTGQLKEIGISMNGGVIY